MSIAKLPSVSGQARILDGAVLAAKIKAELKSKVSALRSPVGLGTIVVGSDPGSLSYVAGKHRDCAEVGINSIQIELDESASDSEILGAIEKLNRDPLCTGFILQLPLPGDRNPSKFLEAIDPAKDCDGLHPVNLGKLVLSQPAPKPCTPVAIVRLLEEHAISLQSAEVVIIGRGTTVGRPLALLISDKKYNATVTTIHSRSKDPSELIKRADIVVAAVGKKYFLTPDMVKSGAVVVDVGITRESGKLFGDVDPGVADVASFISPMPGGVGPVTRAILLENIVKLASGDVD
jgi:methylenetetrahydrofolate dehydrogenase (NADP+)/methenyltetrahydrofolate cyclohydrolase